MRIVPTGVSTVVNLGDDSVSMGRRPTTAAGLECGALADSDRQASSSCMAPC